MTARNQEDIVKGNKYVKEKVLAPSVCLRLANGQLCDVFVL